MNVWIWLETYPVTWWHDTNTTRHEIMKKVVQYSFSFGDNNNVFDNTTKTIAGRVSILYEEIFIHKTICFTFCILLLLFRNILTLTILYKFPPDVFQNHMHVITISKCDHNFKM